MNEILDEDLQPKRPVKKSLYGRYSNIPASIVILSALLKILHLPYGDELLLFGISAHFGIELGYLIVLKGKSPLNLKRFLIGTFFFIMITRLWRIDTMSFTSPKWLVIFSTVVISCITTHWLVKKQLRKLRSKS